MSHLRWQGDRPRLHRPVLLSAFEGWNDAGEAATTAVRFLSRTLGAERAAVIDAEEFYDFTVARPHVRLGDDNERVIDWPDPVLDVARLGNGRHLVLLTGIEPALRWRTFGSEVATLARSLDVEGAYTLGSLLADVPHTRPVRVTGTATDPALAARLGFTRSRYEGPTGILSILGTSCQAAGIPSASLWATTPHYLHETASPKAALALVDRLATLLEFSVDTTELHLATLAYEAQVAEMLAGEDDIADYVRHLEDEASHQPDPFELPNTDELASEVERFLRDQRGPN